MATSSSQSLSPKAERPRRHCHFDSTWVQKFPGIAKSSKGKYIASRVARVYRLLFCLTQVMALHSVHIVYLTSVFPTVD